PLDRSATGLRDGSHDRHLALIAGGFDRPALAFGNEVALDAVSDLELLAETAVDVSAGRAARGAPSDQNFLARNWNSLLVDGDGLVEPVRLRHQLDEYWSAAAGRGLILQRSGRHRGDIVAERHVVATQQVTRIDRAGP